MKKFHQPYSGKSLAAWFSHLLLLGCLSILAACTDGSSSSATLTISGTVTGLNSGAQVTLNNNGVDPLIITANGQFTFARQIAHNGSYAITVDTQPTGQTCTVTNFTGAGIIANVTDVTVTCSSTTFTIGGSVTGLAAGNQVVLNNNGADPLTVTASQPLFTFATPVAFNSSATIAVATQPGNQVCTVTNNPVANITKNITDITVVCSAQTFTIGGSVTGLNPLSQVTLINNGTDPLTITADGAFTFSKPVAANSSYKVTIDTPPNSEICTISNGVGTGINANVTTVLVSCGTLTKTILHTFAGNPLPNALIQGGDGNFYGTTLQGGATSQGSLFTVTLPTVNQSAVYTELNSFGVKGNSPANYGLIQAGDGNFYGTTIQGGNTNNGTIFTFSLTTGFRPLLFEFPIPSSTPLIPGNMIQGSDGNFYGTTQAGGAQDQGTIFRFSPGVASPLTVLHEFNGPDGSAPLGGLIQANDGNYYGTTNTGGINDKGTFFRMTPTGELTTLYSFTGGKEDGLLPLSLIQGNDGSFYGTAGGGGSSTGVIFHLSPTGTPMPALKSFTDGITPRSKLIQANDGYFYGTTQGNNIFEFEPAKNTIFRVNAQGKFESLVDNVAASVLIQGSDDNFYGVESSVTKQISTVFKLAVQ